jgi:lysophospholipase L1-like esterase
MHFNYAEINADNTKYFKINGRTLFENGLVISWSNSGVELNFKGNKIEFDFAHYTAEQPVYVKGFTEKGEQRFGLCGSMPKVIFDFENEKTHKIKLLRISEGDVPLVLKSIRIYGKNPEFLNPPAEKKLKLEFLGDSITAGYGVLAPADRDVYYTFEEDSTKTYAYLTVALLDADIRTEAYSGQGVYRNCGGEVGYQFKRIFDMAIRVKDGYDHSQWTPDVMILNCGTNDVPGGTDEDTMYKEADLLIDKVRSVYPSAKIIWTYGMMNEKFHSTFKKVVGDKKKKGDSNLYYLPLEKITPEKDERGAVGHPNVNASVRVSKKLAKFITKIL